MNAKSFAITALVANLMSFVVAYGAYLFAAEKFGAERLDRLLDGWTIVAVILPTNVLITTLIAFCTIYGRR